jgi:intracellular septation protein
MKFLFDMLPVIAFFIAFKVWDIFVATAVAIGTTMLEVAYLKARGRKVDTMLWVSLGIIVVFGGATLVLHDEVFIKWKPTILYWMFSGTLAVALLAFRKNLIRALLEPQNLLLPDQAWGKLNWAWAGFFLFMGLLNLYVAFNYSTDTWVNFKLFGATGLLMIFVILQAPFLARHMVHKDAAAEGQPVRGPDS